MSKTKQTTDTAAPKSNTDLAEVTATLQQTSPGSLYEESASFLGPIATAMRCKGAEYAKLRLTLGFYLEWIAQREKGALTRFVKMAAKGQLASVGFPAMAERTLYGAKDFFKQAAKAVGLPLAEVSALRDSMASDGKGGALDLFSGTPADADDVRSKLSEWIETRGVAGIDEAMAEAAAAKFAGGGGGSGAPPNLPPPGGGGTGGESPLTDEELNLLTAHGGLQSIRAFMNNPKAWHELPVSECPNGCAELQHCSHTLNALDDLLGQFRELVQAKVTDTRRRKK